MSGEARRAVSIYTRRKWLLLAIVVLIPAAVYGISKMLPKTYQASTDADRPFDERRPILLLDFAVAVGCRG